ncbi:MAG: chorismate synthase [candidate division NC10 bacterium]|nr:chorismate synthase [candidate division NC10 bacterium]
MLRYMTAGESHGPALVAILEGMPSNVPVTAADINSELRRRMGGYGRGGRMKIEQDEVQILGGIRHGKTLGSPIALVIRNRDWENWKTVMAPEAEAAQGEPDRPPMTRPRPGHADLIGGLKYDHQDLRNVLERASARETAARVAVGAACKCLLRQFGIQVVSHVVEMGGIRAKTEGLTAVEIVAQAEASPVRCADPDATQAILAKVDEARARGTSLGGVFEVLVVDPPVGLGSYVHWDHRLDGRLAQALMSIQAIKGVEIGLGFETARRFGFEVQDEIFYRVPAERVPDRGAAEGEGFHRRTNFGGGLEGGMTTGQPLVLRAAMKPLSTQYKPLASVDILTKEASRAGVERSDITAVPAAGVVGEAVVAFVIAQALCEKFGADSLAELQRNHSGYVAYLKSR